MFLENHFFSRDLEKKHYKVRSNPEIIDNKLDCFVPRNDGRRCDYNRLKTDSYKKRHYKYPLLSPASPPPPTRFASLGVIHIETSYLSMICSSR
jgi:hypothetical protein